MKKFEVVVIGAGPAGLCLSYHLKNLGITHSILEKAETVGDSWANMPEHLSLISLWKSNYLIPEDKNAFPYFSHVKAKDFHQYLVTFAARHSLPVELKSEVVAIEKKDELFEVQTKTSTLYADNVVICTGYYSSPWMPDTVRSIKSIPVVHMKDFKNSHQFQPYKRILLIGKRLSAGQILEELSDKHDISVSIRSPLEFTLPPFFYKALLIFLDELEALVKWFRPAFKDEVEVKMESKVKPYFAKNKIKVVSEIKEVNGKVVTFKDNSSSEFDAIISATGFIPQWPFLKERPEFKNLHHGFESTNERGMYFLGFSSQRSFVSRFLRGIRVDALALANLIAGKDQRKK